VKFSSGVTAALAALLIAVPTAVADEPVVDPTAPVCLTEDGANCADSTPATDGSDSSDSQDPSTGEQPAEPAPDAGSNPDPSDPAGGTDDSTAPTDATDTGSGEESGPSEETPQCKMFIPDADGNALPCPIPYDPPVVCALARFASEEAASAAGCGGPFVDPHPVDCYPAPESEDVKCPLIVPEPPTLDVDGCFKTSDGHTVCVCYDEALASGTGSGGGPKITDRGHVAPKGSKPPVKAKHPKSASKSAKAKARAKAKAKAKARAKAKAKAKARAKAKAKAKARAKAQAKARSLAKKSHR